MTITWNGWNALLASPPPWAHLVCASERDVESVLRWQTPRDIGIVVRIVRGEHCMTKSGVFDEWGAALQFPYYFGKNWDAFNDCINDLGWLPGRAYLFIITHANLLLHDHADFATFTSILDDAATRWMHQNELGSHIWRIPASFHVVFHCDLAQEAETRHRFKAANIALDTLTLP